ncbi:hypothetical protein MPLB_1490053 [Mesorhizobium sp. ORS 3324]|nr:hypothetical protein MPLB_1490053 [Mesorhizobium sp. ORS 3324]
MQEQREATRVEELMCCNQRPPMVFLLRDVPVPMEPQSWNFRAPPGDTAMLALRSHR